MVLDRVTLRHNLSNRQTHENYAETIAYVKVDLNSYTNKLKSSSQKHLCFEHWRERGW